MRCIFAGMHRITNPPLIEYSAVESETLKLKVARCNQSYFDPAKLKKILFEVAYDICRLKVDSKDEFAPYRLAQLGMPSYFSGSIRRYKTPIEQVDDLQYKHVDLVFETHTNDTADLLFEMLKDTWGSYPLGYYRSPALHSLIDKETEIKSVFNFYHRHNVSGANPNNSIQFIKHQENYVGFFALNKVNNHLESHIGGILSPFREAGYFHDMLVYIKKYCKANKLTHFVFGARNENAEVQRAFHFAGFVPVGTENVFHLCPLLSLKSYMRCAGLLEDEVNKIQQAKDKKLVSMYADGEVNYRLAKGTVYMAELQSEELMLTCLKAVDLNGQVESIVYLSFIPVV